MNTLEYKIDLLLSDRLQQVNFVGDQHQPTESMEVDGLEGQEKAYFVNANGTWYKRDNDLRGNFQSKPQYQNNYQQKLFYNNQQSCY